MHSYCDRVIRHQMTLCLDVPLVEFTYLVFTCMPGESYHRQLRFLLLHLCNVFRVLINSLVQFLFFIWVIQMETLIFCTKAAMHCRSSQPLKTFLATAVSTRQNSLLQLLCGADIPVAGVLCITLPV